MKKRKKIAVEKIKSEIIHSDDEEKLSLLELREEIRLNQFIQELQLKSLLLAWVDKNQLGLLLRVIKEYYSKGHCYYIVWVIMLFVVVEDKNTKLNVQIIDIFLDIENNNYYGLCSIEM